MKKLLLIHNGKCFRNDCTKELCRKVLAEGGRRETLDAEIIQGVFAAQDKGTSTPHMNVFITQRLPEYLRGNHRPFRIFKAAYN